jgi:hypothetical protein
MNKRHKEVNYTQGQFLNNDSLVGFIHGYDSIEQVVAQDSAELKAIGGSFTAIADKMDELIAKCEQVSELKDRKRAEIFKKFGYDHDSLLSVPGDEDDLSTDRGKIWAEINKLYDNPIVLEDEVEIEHVRTLLTRGFQLCPFKPCNAKASSSQDYIIRNKKTGRELWINQITSHLARDHSLLEKGNEYGITAKDFYEYFMPKKR